MDRHRPRSYLLKRPLGGRFSRQERRRGGVLPDVYDACILWHMRTTIVLRDDLLAKAQEATGIKEKTALVHAGLQALIDRERERRLAALGGTEPGLAPPRRRRPA